MGKMRKMGKMGRIAVAAGVALLAVGLTGGLVANYVGQPGIGALPRDPVELLYVPQNATVVAYADVRAIVDSDLGPQIRQLLLAPAGAGNDARLRFEEETGINVERDIEHVVAYVAPSETDRTTSRGVVLARGRFDRARLEKLGEQNGATIEAYKGKRLIVPRANGSGEATALVLIEPGLIAVGSSAAVRRAVDLESGGALTISANQTVMTLIHDVDDGHGWAVGDFSGLADWLKLPARLAANFSPITHFAATSRIDNGVRGLLRAEAADEQAAQQLHDIVSGFLTLAKLQNRARLDLQAALEALQLRVEGKAAILSFALPVSALQALAAQPVP